MSSFSSLHCRLNRKKNITESSGSEIELYNIIFTRYVRTAPRDVEFNGKK